VIADDAAGDLRLLFLAATSKDAANTTSLVSPLGIRLEVCRTFEALLEEVALMPFTYCDPTDPLASTAGGTARRIRLPVRPLISNVPSPRTLADPPNGRPVIDSGTPVMNIPAIAVSAGAVPSNTTRPVAVAVGAATSATPEMS